MKKVIYPIIALFIVFSAFSSKEETLYKIDNNLSSVEWVGKKITGSHQGTIMIKEGVLKVTDGAIVDGAVAIDMQSISVTDIKDEGTRAKLTGHLSSDDFFGVKKHPISKFKLKNVEDQGGGQFKIVGTIEIKGITQGIMFPAAIQMEEEKMNIMGEVEINRTDFGIKYGSGSFFDNLGDKAIYDNFLIRFKLVANK